MSLCQRRRSLTATHPRAVKCGGTADRRWHRDIGCSYAPRATLDVQSEEGVPVFQDFFVESGGHNGGRWLALRPRAVLFELPHRFLPARDVQRADRKQCDTFATYHKLHSRLTRSRIRDHGLAPLNRVAA